MSDLDPKALLEVARQICEEPSPALVGRWQRAAAIIARAAVEAMIDDYWQARAPGVLDCLAVRSKMLCLPTYLGDPELAHDVYQLWAVLSSACHRHAYELEPTAGELERWIDKAEEIQASLGTAA